MPIYEYRCGKCRRVLGFLVRDVKKHRPPACPKCGHPKMERVFSRFAAVSGTGEEGMPDLDKVDERDPRSVGRMMRRLADASGEGMPPEMDEMCRRLESGEDPEKIEREMGDTLGEGGPPGPSDDTLYEG